MNAPPSVTAAIGRMMMAPIFALVLATGIAARGDSIRLYDQAGGSGPSVTLVEVAELDGDRAMALAAVVVGSFAGDQPQIDVSLDQVRSALSGAGVDWGLVALRGHRSCQVLRVPVEPEPVVALDAVVASNLQSPIDLDSALTLMAVVERKVAQRAGVPRRDLRISFNERDQDQLRRPLGLARFELEPRAASAIGRVPLVIRRYERGRVVESFTVTADVQKRALALVATGTIQKGSPFTADSVELREVYLRDDRGEPIADTGLVVGQWASALLRRGAVIYPEHVRGPVLIKRGDLVTVRWIGAGLVVRTVARAVETGSLDDRIQVRNESSRQTYQVAVAGPSQAVILLDDLPPAPPAGAGPMPGGHP